MKKKIIVILALSAVLCLTVNLAASTPTQMSPVAMSSVQGGLADCGTLAGATAAAAFLAGFGAITLLPAIIGGAALVVLC